MLHMTEDRRELGSSGRRQSASFHLSQGVMPALCTASLRNADIRLHKAVYGSVSTRAANSILKLQ